MVPPDVLLLFSLQAPLQLRHLRVQPPFPPAQQNSQKTCLSYVCIELRFDTAKSPWQGLHFPRETVIRKIYYKFSLFAELNVRGYVNDNFRLQVK